MSCEGDAIALAKNKIICLSEFEAYLKCYYSIIKKVMLVPRKDVLGDRFFKDHIYIYNLLYILLDILICYLFYLLLYT